MKSIPKTGRAIKMIAVPMLVRIEGETMRRNMIKTVGVVLFFTAGSLWAEVQLSSVFSDNMVLQRGMPVPVWGTAEVGEKVAVDFNGQRVTTTAAANGRWQAELAPMQACSESLTMTVQGTNAITIRNVVMGDVWICSGQSNMVYMLEKDAQAETEIPKSANRLIRILKTDWQASDTPLEAVKYSGSLEGATWHEASPETSGQFTAVGYWFAKELNKSLGVPVGLVTAYKNGSPGESWLTKEFLIANKESKWYWEKYQEALKVFPQKHEIYKKERAEWEAKVKGLTRDERLKIKPPRMPYGPFEPHRPSALFYGSVSPLIPFAIKGVVWYQGESNSFSIENARNYGTLMPDIIRSWRAAWGREDLPFLLVQLAPLREMSPVPQDTPLAHFRESQAKALALPNTGMAITLDAGDEKDIHPRSKQPVGDRLAQWAKAMVYGMDVVPSGPLFEKMEVQDDKIVITFKHAGKGLEARDLTLVGDHQLSKEKLQGFAICGEDKEFVWADARITAPNQVTVSSTEVLRPVAARYAWASFPLCNLYNKDGFPAGPFRTDTFEPVILPGAR